MNTPIFELDRSSAAFIAMLEVDSPMMQAPERRWLWSCLRRRRAHWRFGIIPETIQPTSAFAVTDLIGDSGVSYGRCKILRASSMEKASSRTGIPRLEA